MFSYFKTCFQGLLDGKGKHYLDFMYFGFFSKTKAVILVRKINILQIYLSKARSWILSWAAKEKSYFKSVLHLPTSPMGRLLDDDFSDSSAFAS